MSAEKLSHIFVDIFYMLIPAGFIEIVHLADVEIMYKVFWDTIIGVTGLILLVRKYKKK